MFPYIDSVDGKIKNQCTEDISGNFICATFVNDDLTMPYGSFGVCKAGCPGTGTGNYIILYTSNFVFFLKNYHYEFQMIMWGNNFWQQYT